MKPQNFHVSVIFLLFVLLHCSFVTSARLLAPKQGEKDNGVKAHGTAHGAESFTDLKNLSNLLGLEECDDKDEECLTRRMIAEAHLDYIYTQHHKP